jgi:general secretion pathway protein G
MMVVIVIVGLLAGATTMSVRSYLIRGKQSVALMEIAKIAQAIDTFYTAYDRYPTTEEGLDSLVVESDEFPDGLLSKIPKDPWKNEYAYVSPGREAGFDVVSYGADGREGGEGANRDITSSELEEDG